MMYGIDGNTIESEFITRKGTYFYNTSHKEYPQRGRKAQFIIENLMARE